MPSLEVIYRQRYDATLTSLASSLEKQLLSYCAGQMRIDRIVARPKAVEKFIVKSQTTIDGKLKYSEPLRQIQDQIGARIITFYLSDVVRICKIVEKYYRPIKSKVHVPDSEWKFGYFGKHYVFHIPTDITVGFEDKSLLPEFFELQVKTLFQHAWSEANHDVGYKPGQATLKPDAERRLAFASAQAWGADHMFDELFNELTR